MKIKEIIADTMAKKDNEPYPIDFPMFVQHMAAILVYVSARAAKTDVPAVCLGGDVLGGGKGKTKVCETDLVDILTGRDLVRRRIVITQLSRFLEWFVEQEKNPADNDPAWCDFEYIAEKSTTPPIHHEWMGLAGEGRPFSVSPVDQPQPC